NGRTGSVDTALSLGLLLCRGLFDRNRGGQVNLIGNGRAIRSIRNDLAGCTYGDRRRRNRVRGRGLLLPSEGAFVDAAIQEFTAAASATAAAASATAAS